MKDENRFFTVFPSVVKAGDTTEITITSLHERKRFNKNVCKLRVVPKEKGDVDRAETLHILDKNCNIFPVEVKEDKITFSYNFKDEQEYLLLLMSEKGEWLHRFSVYALNDDLYETMPYRGDLHLHTTCSDGLGTISQMVSSYREMGMDFMCITDHHKLYPSQEAQKMLEGVDSGLTIFTGEEVHNMSMGHIHIVNFGGKYSVNEILEADYEGLVAKLKKEAEKDTELSGTEALEFALRKWICEEIRKSGGKAIFPHPYWCIPQYHSETDYSIYTLKQGIYDIYEVFGGTDVKGNQIQEALWQHLRLEGLDMPIVGTTDTHDYLKGTSLFGLYSTLVFAKDENDITDAIMRKNSVAVETIEGEEPHIAGSFRLLKYALFLMEHFYPVYETYTKDLGALMRCYMESGDCKEAIEGVNAKAQDYKRKFFNKI